MVRITIVATSLLLMAGACQREQSATTKTQTAQNSFAVIETAWTKEAAERAEKEQSGTLRSDPNNMKQYALPEVRIYNRQQQLIFHENGVQPSQTAATLTRVIDANKPIAGPTIHQTIADLETVAHEPASTAVHARDRITIFDYWAEWCVPCKVLEKELLAWAADQPGGSVQIVRAEADPTKLARARGAKIIMMTKDANGKMVKKEMN